MTEICIDPASTFHSAGELSLSTLSRSGPNLGIQRCTALAARVVQRSGSFSAARGRACLQGCAAACHAESPRPSQALPAARPYHHRAAPRLIHPADRQSLTSPDAAQGWYSSAALVGSRTRPSRGYQRALGAAAQHRSPPERCSYHLGIEINSIAIKRCLGETSAI